MYCGKCGKEIKDDYKFCDNCSNETNNEKETNNKIGISFENKYLKLAGIIATLIIIVFFVNSIRANTYIKAIKIILFMGIQHIFKSIQNIK